MDSGTGDFLDEVLSRIRSHLDGSEKVVEHIPQSSLRKIADLNIPLEGMGLENITFSTDIATANTSFRRNR